MAIRWACTVQGLQVDTSLPGDMSSVEGRSWKPQIVVLCVQPFKSLASIPRLNAWIVPEFRSSVRAEAIGSLAVKPVQSSVHSGKHIGSTLDGSNATERNWARWGSAWGRSAKGVGQESSEAP
jgi:hypothetical protein